MKKLIVVICLMFIVSGCNPQNMQSFSDGFMRGYGPSRGYQMPNQNQYYRPLPPLMLPERHLSNDDYYNFKHYDSGSGRYLPGLW